MRPMRSEAQVGKKDVFVSVVAVLDATTSSPASLAEEIHSELEARYTNYEIVLVDNGVETAALAGLLEALTRVPCIRILRLSRIFPYDTAVFSALESVIGDYTVVIEAETDPTSAIPRFVDAMLSGADIVQGKAHPRQGLRWAERWGRHLFYQYNRRALNVSIPGDATYLTGFTRRSLTVLLSNSRRYRYLRHLMRHIGFQILDIPYVQQSTGGKKRRLRSSAVEAVEMITSYSVHPLRMMSATGLLVAIANLLYAIYVVAAYFSVSNIEPGWTTTSLQISIMFFFTSIAVAVFSEYIGRLLIETRREPAYFIMEELVSDQLLADESRRNVV